MMDGAPETAAIGESAATMIGSARVKVKEEHLATSGERPSDELLYCVKNYVDLYGETVDPKELCESLARGHGFDVSLDTVLETLSILQSKPKIIYGREYKDYTKMRNGSPSVATVEEGTVSINAVDPPRHVSTADREQPGSPVKRKVKLTHDILQIVAATLDEETEVHSLLSLKRILERKGIFISKTSVYRALEKLGRSIVEKKKQNKTNRVVVPPKGLPVLQTAAAQSKGPLDLSKKASKRPSQQTDRPMTVAEMLDKHSMIAGPPVGKKPRRIRMKGQATEPAAATQQVLAVTAGGQTMLLSGHVMPPKKLRALLPKPTESGASPRETRIAAAIQVVADPSNGQMVANQGLLMQTQQEAVAIASQPITAIPLRQVVTRTPTIVNVTGSPIDYTQVPKASPTAHPVTSSPVETPTSSIQPPTGAVKKEKESEEDGQPLEIKIEIDDPTYRTKETDDEFAGTDQKTVPRTTTPTLPVSKMNTVTPPPRIESLHGTVNHHSTERLTKSVSPQLLTSSGTSGSIYRENHDVKGRAIQQFRLSKAIGKIVSARAQGQTARAPRKPSVVFHRPSSNSVPLQVGNNLPNQSSSPRKSGLHARLSEQQMIRYTNARSLHHLRHQLRSRRSVNLRPRTQRMHPTSMWKEREATMTNQRRMAARMQQLVSTSPLYYQSDLNDELLPELEIDPPDTQDAEGAEEGAEGGSGQANGQANERPNRLNQNGIDVLMRQSLVDMTKQMRKMSQHMETIQGQLQVIVEFLPNLLPRDEDTSHEWSRSQQEEEEGTPATNGGYQGSSSSPPSVEEQSVDSDDPTMGENASLRQEIEMDFKELPKIGSPESDALINEVMCDVRWGQLSVYAGAPRLAISLARYCIFGTKVLMESSVTGRNSKSPLSHSAMKRIRELLHEKYGHRCSKFEFEMVWKTSRESISQLCKRLRRKYRLSEGSQEDFVIDAGP